MKDVLTQILAHKKTEVDDRKQQTSMAQLCERIETMPKHRRSLKQALENSQTGIIAEFKRRSPSKGWINEAADATIIGRQYQAAGAAAISTLTDHKYFGGNETDLRLVLDTTHIPVLRKEFIIDEYQIYESRAMGASAILLIAAAMTKEQCRHFTQTARGIGLDVLLELHDEHELDHISPQNNIVGINNRNLGTFDTTVEKSLIMAKHLPREAVRVSESGISSPETVVQLREAGYGGFLIGENFMKTDNPGNSLKQFIEAIAQ